MPVLLNFAVRLFTSKIKKRSVYCFTFLLKRQMFLSYIFEIANIYLDNVLLLVYFVYVFCNILFCNARFLKSYLES